jgi:hypothetical protein
MSRDITHVLVDIRRGFFEQQECTVLHDPQSRDIVGRFATSGA